jgi:hypothetical protein
MKSFKNILRLWISFTSIFGFFGAWAMLAQSFKPAQDQPTAVTTYPTLAALAPINLNPDITQSNVNLQVITPTPSPIPPPQPRFNFRPALRTGAS